MTLKELTWLELEEKIAERFAQMIAATIQARSAGHRLAVEVLSPSLLLHLCDRLVATTALPPKTRIVVVTDRPAKPYEVMPTKLIELRDDKTVDYLLAFVPTTFRSYAEDSFGEHTFEVLNTEEWLRVYEEELLKAIEGQGVLEVSEVLRSARVKQTEHHLRYLLSVLQNGPSYQIAGALLYLVGLVPDLSLDQTNLVVRLADNRRKFEEKEGPRLADPSLALMEKIRRLQLKDDLVRGELLALLGTHGAANVEAWGREIANRAAIEKDPKKRLTLDNWLTEEIEANIELEFVPLGKSNPGLLDRAGTVNVPKTGKVKVRWGSRGPGTAQLDHFVLKSFRDEEQLFATGKIRGNKRTHTLKLGSYAVEEGHCKLRIEGISSTGTVLAADTSDIFWITGEPPEIIEPSEEARRGEQVLTLIEARFWRAQRTSDWKGALPTEVRWEATKRGGHADKVVITFGGRDKYFINCRSLFRKAELSILASPRRLGTWNLDPDGVLTIGEEIDFSRVNDGVCRAFLAARDEVFKAIKLYQPPGAVGEAEEDFCNIVETTCLLELKEKVKVYAQGYKVLLQVLMDQGDVVNLCKTMDLDSLHTTEGIVLTPLHPLKLLWFLQYQLLLEYLSEGSVKAPRSVDKQALRIVHSINYPAFTPDLGGQLQINTSQLDLLWSGFSAEPNAYQSIRSSAQLGVSALSESQYQAIDSRRIREKIQEYLELNPHIRQVRVGVINPGDAENFLQAAREIHLALSKTRELRYDFRFYGKERIEDLASSFDRLMTEEDERRRKEVDDELLEAAGNLMAPKLVYSKHAQEELVRSEDNPADECHLLFAIDCFNVKLATIERVPENSGSFLGNLINDYVSAFEVSDERASWTHTIVPQSECEIEVLSVLGCLMKECLDVSMHASALLASGKQTPWPCVVLEIGKEEKKLINAAHRLADWVAFVDKHFGVDFIDHPSSPFCEYYLVDYCPSPKEGVGHKLIVSTASEEGLRRAVVGALESLGLPRESAPEVFSGLQAISGRLLIKLLTSRNFAKEAISIVLLWLLSKEKGELATKIFVPIDPHQELVGSAEGEPGYRTDALLVSIAPKSKEVQIDLIETKIRSALQIQEILDLKDKITKQVEQTQRNLTSILSKPDPVNLLHNSHYRKALQDVLRFYLDRGLRHNLISSAGYDALVKGLDSLRQWDLSTDVSKFGYIFSLGRPDSYEERGPDGITFHLIGKDKILQLLAAEEVPAPLKVEVGEPTPSEAGTKVTVEEVVPTTVEEVVKAPAQEEQVTAATAISVYLGKDLVSGRLLFWEPAKELPRKLTNPHILIVGTSGSGKTQTTMALLYEMWRQGVPSLVLDFHGEYADPKMGKFRSQTSAQVVDALAGLPVNPLDVPFDAWGKPHNYKRTVWEVSEIIGNIFRLGLQQQRALKRAMEMAYQLAGFSSDSSTWNRRAPKFSQLKEILESQTEERGGVITGLLSRLDVLFDVEIFSDRAPNRFEDLISKVTAVDLSRLFNDEHRLVVARFFLQKVYNHMLLQGESRDLKMFVVVDEAHRLSYDETLLRLIREARKYGVGILLSSQEPSDFPTTAIELPGTKIFQQQGPRGSRALGSHLEPSEAKRRVQVEEELQKLEVGQAFIRNDHFLPYVKARIQLFYERV